MPANVAGTGQPDFLTMTRDMLQGPAQMTQAEWLTHDEGVQGNGKYKGLIDRLFQHFIKIIYDGVGVLLRGHFVQDDVAVVVQFHWIGHGEYGLMPGLHPNRLIVATPVHVVAVTGFAQQIQCCFAL